MFISGVNALYSWFNIPIILNSELPLNNPSVYNIGMCMCYASWYLTCSDFSSIYQTSKTLTFQSYTFKESTNSYFSKFSKKIYFIFREGKGGREREQNISVQEIHWSVASCTPPPLQTRPTVQACALTENRTSNTSVHRPTLNPLSHTSQGLLILNLLKRGSWNSQIKSLNLPLTMYTYMKSSQCSH